MSERHTLYITLQYLRTVNEDNKYHWGLWATESSPPRGYLFHATDAGRRALDLYFEARRVSDPSKSKSMVVCLKIANAPSIEALEHFASRIPLMNPQYLPQGECQWTCRVWVKATLNALHHNRQIVLPTGIDAIESHCKTMADYYVSDVGRARIFNNLRWLSEPPESLSLSLSLSPRRGEIQTQPRVQTQQRLYYGPSAMETETHQHVGSGSSPAVTISHRQPYFGPSPMDTGY